MKSPSFLRRSLVFAGLGLLGVLGACERAGSHPAFHSTDITGATYANQLSLPDADGHVRTLADWKGKVVVVFFGYTQCPDVCPTTLATLGQIKHALGPRGNRLQAVFVTLDPERDTPAVLKAYVGNFDPAFVALRGTPEQTKAAAKAFKVFYEKVEGSTPGSYTFDHTAGAFVFDPQGRIRLFTHYGDDPKNLQADIVQLIDGS